MTKRYAIGFAAVSSKAQISDDKVSLTEQQADIRAWCQREGYELLEVLVVPGHSRNFLSLEEMNAAMLKAKPPIMAIQRFIQHVEARDFDVLVVREIERLGRQQSVIAQVIAMVVERARARIFAYAPGGGWFDNNNYILGGGLAGFKAGIDKKRLTEGRRVGIANRKTRGLSPQKPPFSHKYIRGDDGKATRMIVDESRRPLLDAIRDTLLDNTAWVRFAFVLAAKGFPVNPSTGRKWTRDYIYWWFLRADVWGNMVTRESDLPKLAIYGFFVFNPDVAPPKGVTVQFDTHEPAWTGEDAKAIQHHLQYIRPLFGGKAQSHHRHSFSKLLLCGDCGRPLSYHSNGRTAQYRCRYTYDAFWGDCDNHKYINVKIVQAWFDVHIRAMLDMPDPDAFFSDYNPPANTDEPLKTLENSLLAAEQHASRLIDDKAAAPPELVGMYDDKLTAVAAEIKVLRAQLDTLKQETARIYVPDRRPALNFLREHMETFWELDETRINDELLALLGNLRVEVKQGRITGFVSYFPTK